MLGALSEAEGAACLPFIQSDRKDDSGFPFFVLADGGACSNRVKAINGEHAGAKLVIIIDESKQTTEHDYSSAGANINIPVLFISVEEGNTLKDVIRKTGSIFMVFEMPVPKSEEVFIEYYVADTDVKMFQFIAGFKTYSQQFGDKIVERMNLFKVIATDEDKAKLQQIFNCVPKDYFHDYVQAFADTCAKDILINSSCGKTQIKTFGKAVESAITKCIDSTSVKTIMSTMKERSEHSKSYLTINHKVYHGSFRPNNLFEAVCGAFVKSPDNCLYLNNKFVAHLNYTDYQNSARRNGKLIWTLAGIGVLALLILAGMAMSVLFGKIYTRILQERVPEMVRESVTNYQSLKSNQ